MFLISLIGKVGNKKPPFCSVVIAAAGESQRMGGVDKLFAEIHGIPVLVHTLLAFQGCAEIAEIVIVVRQEHLERVGRLCEDHRITKVAKIIAGGHTRLASVTNGVFAVSKKAKLIAIHDGARPCVSQEIIKCALLEAAKLHASAPAVPVDSTIKRVRGKTVVETIDRGDVFEIQTPQVFNSDLIKAALTNAANKSIKITDDCMAVEALGVNVSITQGSRQNIKLTTSEDIILAEAILRRVESRELRVES